MGRWDGRGGWNEWLPRQSRPVLLTDVLAERGSGQASKREREKEEDGDVLGKHESSVDTRVRTRTRKSINGGAFRSVECARALPSAGNPGNPEPPTPPLGVPCARFWLIHRGDNRTLMRRSCAVPSARVPLNVFFSGPRMRLRWLR
jgi:hypothetical protein